MLVEKANVTGALYSSVEASLHCHHQLTRVQVSLLRRCDMHSSHLSNESQYPCDEHVTEITQLKELSANLCPQ